MLTPTYSENVLKVPLFTSGANTVPASTSCLLSPSGNGSVYCPVDGSVADLSSLLVHNLLTTISILLILVR